MLQVFMKSRIFFIFIFIIAFGKILNAHDQEVHQHICREAFKLLQKSFPGQLTEMANYLGYDEYTNPGIVLSFGAGKIVSGAWLEDEYDIAYHYGISNMPNYNQTLPFEFLMYVTNNNRQAHTSISHFWNADGGENASTFLSDKYSGIYWSFSIGENACKKVKLYRDGGFGCRVLYNQASPLPTSVIQTIICGGYDFEYKDIIDLYKNGSYKLVKYMGLDENWYSMNYPWEQMTTEYRKKRSYEILGRMCHLLGDMSVPAHVHNTSHANTGGMRYDLYELEAANPSSSIYHMWTANELWSKKEKFIDPYDNGYDPLYFLMYFMNQLADHYADAKTNGDNNFDSNFPFISIIIPKLGKPRYSAEFYYSPTLYNDLKNMHNVLMPYAIRLTAGLMYWFARETGQLPSPAPPISVSISGPSTVRVPDKNMGTRTYSWTANVTNGTSPVYKWYQKTSGSYYYIGSGKTYSKTYSYLGYQRPSTFYLKVEVTDTEERTASATKSVYMIHDSYGIPGPIARDEDNPNIVTIPKKYELQGNYPNPFNPTTTIRFGLPNAENVLLQVFNVNGQLVSKLIDKYLEPGYHNVEFNGQQLSSGIYLYKLTTNNFSSVKRMLLVK